MTIELTEYLISCFENLTKSLILFHVILMVIFVSYILIDHDNDGEQMIKRINKAFLWILPFMFIIHLALSFLPDRNQMYSLGGHPEKIVKEE